ncbi:pyridoxamine 5'-phosphate oxidase family protein [Streptomyces albidoflavus]|uniref:pyridoxamine 5'-phosphate oxidase family protein n=1 Tax=Streptomyces TaxID=1883 RepID=UPI00063E81AF|nr:pyridoxamine 5'-phosphate oxidase family protein [Streptomyces sp. KE1]KLJ04632.1 pyridoxamine 5'-phosphate oxidase [Streptomyces sp. KE1]
MTTAQPAPAPAGPRTRAERRRDTLARLGAERDVWLATAHPEHGPYQVPLWFRWDGRAVWCCTAAASPTVRNLRADPRARLALPDSFDVVQMEGRAACFTAAEVPGEAADGFAARFGWDPRTEEAPYVYLRVVPDTVRAWRGVPELRGRLILRDGEWRE